MLCIDIHRFNKIIFLVAHKYLDKTTAYYLCICEINFYSIKCLSTCHSTSISSRDKLYTFNEYSWFESMLTVDNTNFIGHKFKHIVKHCTGIYQIIFCRRQWLIPLMARIFSWSHIIIKILFKLSVISITQRRSLVLFLLLGHIMFACKSVQLLVVWSP